MNDRFKFRVVYYNDVGKKYFIFEPDLISADGTARAYAYGESGADEYYDIVTLNQCTGLKDKNGKLIYEGDIVNYDDRDLDPWHTPILNVVIEMRKYQWCMVYYRKDIINADTRKPTEQKTWLGFDDFISSRIEVIGNIYENKSLLESER